MSRCIIPQPTITPAHVDDFDKDVQSFIALTSSSGMERDNLVAYLVSIGQGLSHLLNTTRVRTVGQPITGEHLANIGFSHEAMRQERLRGQAPHHACFVDTCEVFTRDIDTAFNSEEIGDPQLWGSMSEGEKCVSTLAQMMANWRAAVNEPGLCKKISAHQASSA